MSEASRPDFTRMSVRFERPGTDEVEVLPGLEYRATEAGALVLDLYRSRERGGAARGAVIVATGYSDVGARRLFGRATREMAPFRSWARLLAASGLVALLHETGIDPRADLAALHAFVCARAGELGLDPSRLGVLGCSGHGPNAVALAMDATPPLRALALLYAYTLDEGGETAVAEAAATFRFSHPTAGRSVAELPEATAYLLVRAGGDECPGLNVALERFFAAARARGLDVALRDVTGAPHAFDLLRDDEASRAAIGEILAFFVGRLRAGEP